MDTLDPDAPLADLEPLRDMVGEASVVALGVAARDTHELSVVAHRILRFLVEHMRFRSFVLEGDDAASAAIDAYVRKGVGDPRALMGNARSFWRTEELVDVVTWLRGYNRRHPADPVRIAHPEPARYVTAQTGALDVIERMLAENVIQWHEHTGDKLVYWGGTAHTANAAARGIASGGEEITHRNAGSFLRQHFGSGYLSVGLTYDHGSTASYRSPSPPTEFAESALGDAGVDTYLLDLRAPADDPVRTWLRQLTRTRVIGPVYDPDNDAAYHLSGGAFAEWFDLIVHHHEVTPAHLLDR
ncbi:erythromycin esterase family protein [Nocardia sp. BMG51109]|uniref:erythromycin esterase family protein n=1 Tax=Nocardia sp. BMG51109 TaxID=1056816 RepID=UPI0004B58261|nr:erythromycin esterase family protein [Nocardia sp. BMG51109]